MTRADDPTNCLERRMASIDAIAIGMSASHSQAITEADVLAFSSVSGDTNPIHLDEEYAKTTRFKKKIAHGLLSASFFSAIFGTKLPGQGCVYVSQSLNFKRPVYIGDIVIATVTVTSVDKFNCKIFFDTVCKVNNKVVIDGSAELFIP